VVAEFPVVNGALVWKEPSQFFVSSFNILLILITCYRVNNFFLLFITSRSALVPTQPPIIYSHSGGWNWVHSARRPLNGLSYLPRVIMMMENLVEWRLAGETEVLRKNLPQRHFVHHTSHLTDPGSNPGRRGGKPATNRLSYGAATGSLQYNGYRGYIPRVKTTDALIRALTSI
jgi:hypothetical protein